MIVAKLREILLRCHVGIFMAVSFFCFSCTKDQALAKAHLKANNAIAVLEGDAIEFAAADIFKGVFFADGPVADLLPELSEFRINNFIDDPAELESIAALHDNLIEQFEGDYPNFLEDEFKPAMTSGEHGQIEAVLMDAAGKLNSTLESFYLEANESNEASDDYHAAKEDFALALQEAGIDEQDPAALASFTKDYLQTHDLYAVKKVCAFLPVAVVAAAAVALAVVVWSVAVLIEGFWVATSNYAVIDNTSLLRDSLINSIAENLIVS